MLSLRSIADDIGHYVCRGIIGDYKKRVEAFPKGGSNVFELNRVTYFIDVHFIEEPETERAVKFRIGSAIPTNADSRAYFASIKEGLEERLERPYEVGLETDSIGNGKRPVIFLYLDFNGGRLEKFVEDLTKKWLNSPNGKSISVIIEEGLGELFREGAKEYLDALVGANNRVVKEYGITFSQENNPKRGAGLYNK